MLIALHEIMHEPEVAAVSFGFVAWGLNMIVVLAGALYFILQKPFLQRYTSQEVSTWALIAVRARGNSQGQRKADCDAHDTGPVR